MNKNDVQPAEEKTLSLITYCCHTHTQSVTGRFKIKLQLMIIVFVSKRVFSVNRSMTCQKLMLEGDQRSRWRLEMFCLAAMQILRELSVCRWCDSSVQPLGGHSGNIPALMLTLTLTTSLKHEQGHSSPPDISPGTRPCTGFTLCRLSCLIKVFHVWPQREDRRVCLNCEDIRYELRCYN